MTEKNNQKLITPVFRVGFPMLSDPSTRKADNYGKVDDKYKLTAIWTPADFTEAEKDKWRILFTELDSAAQAKFKRSLKEVTKSTSYSHVPKNGKEKTQNGFGEGTWYATLSSKYQPRAYDADKKELDLERAIYAGCYCRASVFVYAYDVSGNRGVAIGIRNLQKVSDGERLDTSDGSSDFDDDLDEKYRNLAASTTAHEKFGSAADDDDEDATLAQFEKLAKELDDDIPF